MKINEELEALFTKIDKQNKGKKQISDQEILNIVQSYRFEKRTKKVPRIDDSVLE